jgi:hypothetical protein
LAALGVTATLARAEDRQLRTYERQQLTDIYFSEGANAGDINGDGHVDIVYGPYWFEGPDFKKKHEIYKPVPQNVNRYSDDNFFNWIYDFNGDGHNDILVVGIPAEPAVIFENPGKDGLDKHWKRHVVLDRVTNESPQFVDIIGDGKPELVCTNHRFYGYAKANWDKPFETWDFVRVSDDSAPERFGHGLGVGDINGDGRLDIMQVGGWYEHPETTSEGPWKFHEQEFTDRKGKGGADMFAYDVDGDGLNDVVTSLQAHDYGLAWYKQSRSEDGEIKFEMQRIMGQSPEESDYGLVFTEPHGVALHDMDGDGLKDIVTGKTYWSHHRKSPMWDTGAVVYVFKLVRGENGEVDWKPYLADPDCGIGRQVSVVDVNGDGLPDIVLGGMKGCHVLIQKVETVDEATWQAAQPKKRGEGKADVSAESGN